MLRRLLIIVAALVALVAFTGTPASAQYNVVVTPGTVVAGGSVTVTGSGCGPNETVQITFTPHTSSSSSKSSRMVPQATPLPPDANVVATGKTDANGEYTITFTVPKGTAPGQYDVEVYCDGYRVAGETIEVVGAPTDTTPGGPTGPIVRTGSDLNGLGLLGAGLLVAGGIILIATKSRRNQANA